MHAAFETPSRWAPFLLPALLLAFVTGLFPFTAEYLLFHPDERHYADAGIVMVQSGDFLTPRTAEGDLRLKKPILPYWCVVAGFKAVGISPLGARLGFLLCGTGVVALAWWGASIVFGARPAACFAAIAAMTHPALLISAPRSVPDVCLALGIMLSACGFLLILRDRRASLAGLGAGFGGGAVAILSKGAPGAAFLGFVIVFFAWRAPALLKEEWRRWAAVAMVALLAGGSWFALMTALHRDELAQQFASDQVGSHRFVSHAWQPFVQLPLCVGLLVAMSGPWLLASLPVLQIPEARSRLAAKPGVQLLLGWGAVYCGLAAAINHVTPRYLLPAAAPLSIVIGGLLAEVDSKDLCRWLRRGAIGATSCAIICTAIVGLLGSGGPQASLLIVVAATAVAVGGAAARTRPRPAWGHAVVIAVAVSGTLLSAGLGLSAWRGAGIAGPVSDSTPQRIVFAGEAAQVAQLRVTFAGRTPVVAASSVRQIESTDMLVIEEGQANAWDLSGRSARIVSHGNHVPAASEVLRFLLQADVNGLMRRIERRFVIAGPRREPDATAGRADEWRLQ